MYGSAAVLAIPPMRRSHDISATISCSSLAADQILTGLHHVCEVSASRPCRHFLDRPNPNHSISSTWTSDDAGLAPRFHHRCISWSPSWICFLDRLGQTRTSGTISPLEQVYYHPVGQNRNVSSFASCSLSEVEIWCGCQESDPCGLWKCCVPCLPETWSDRADNHALTTFSIGYTWFETRLVPPEEKSSQRVFPGREFWSLMQTRLDAPPRPYNRITNLFPRFTPACPCLGIKRS